MTYRLVTALAVGVWLAAAPTSQAQLVFSFSNVGDIQVNDSRTIGVYLNYVGPNPPTNVLANPGLLEADTGLRYSATSGATLSVAIPSGVTFNLDFTDFTAAQGPATTAFTPKVGFTNLVAAVEADTAPFVTTGSPNNTGGTATSLYLGSFTLNAGPVPGAITLEADRRNLPNTFENFVDGNFVNLDSFITPASVQFNVTPIPEPGTLLLTGLAVVGGASRVWRRRR
jgi:hypothetical protein